MIALLLTAASVGLSLYTGIKHNQGQKAANADELALQAQKNHIGEFEAEADRLLAQQQYALLLEKKKADDKARNQQTQTLALCSMALLTSLFFLMSVKKLKS